MGSMRRSPQPPGRWRRWRPGMVSPLFLVPAAVVYAFVVIWPSVQGAGFAFTDWNGLSATKNFVGLQNFAQILRDPPSTGAVWRTLLIAATVTIVQNGLGFLLALGVNSTIKTRGVLRVLLFAPAVVAPVATAYLWQNLFSPTGPLNTVLAALGLPKVDWLGNPSVAVWSICIVIVWQFVGYSMIIFLANLQNIPMDVIEAAHVDGAGAFRRFWYVVAPEMSPSITINLMLSVIGGLRTFDQVWAMTGGGPGGATDTISTLIFKSAFKYGEVGFGLALALVLTLLVAILSGIQYSALARQGR